MAFDLDDLEALLIAAARAGEPLTYSDALAALGYCFTRPLMRQLCAALCEVDSRARGRGDPELAVLVVVSVRASFQLPTSRRECDSAWRKGVGGPESGMIHVWAPERYGEVRDDWRGKLD